MNDAEKAARTMFNNGITYQDALQEFEAAWIEASMERSENNQSRTAREMQIHRNTLARKIERYQRIGILRLVWF